MKSFCKLLILATIAFAVSNCEKDPPPDPSLVGEWRMTDIHADDGVSMSGGITFTYSYHGVDYNTYTTFTENPMEFSSTGSYSLEITQIILGSTTTQVIEVDAFPGTGQWSINGDVLTQVFAGNTSQFEILEFSESTLRLKEDLDATVGGTHTTATVFTTFEKQ